MDLEICCGYVFFEWSWWGIFVKDFLLMADWVETLSIGNFAAEFYYDARNFNELSLI